MQQISFDDFLKVELRVGRVVQAAAFPQARKPAYVLHVDFWPELGVKKSSAQITDLYQPQDLVGRLVWRWSTFPKSRWARSCRNAWLPAFHNAQGHVALCVPDQEVPLARGCCEGRRPRLRLRAV